ncbi:MAG TPA: hypothetical protein VI248_14815 [Kineosporiaceae bacterium]
MFTGIDQVPWASLGAMNGDPTTVPVLLGRLSGQETGLDALADLEEVLFHQGGAVCPAAAAALPFLVEAAFTAPRTIRLGILDLICAIAATAPDVDARWLASEWPTAWQGQVKRLLTLMDDPDPGVRILAAQTVATDPGTAAQVAARIQARHPLEPDPAVRARQMLVIAGIAEAGSLQPPGAADPWLDDVSRADASPSVRLLAELAPRYEPSPRTPPDVERLAGLVTEFDLSVLAASDGTDATWTGVLRWISERLADSPSSQQGLIRELTQRHDDGLREGAAQACAELLTSSTQGQDVLASTMLDRLEDSSPSVRALAATMIAALAPLLSEDVHAATRLAALTGDRTSAGLRRNVPLAALAAWGLARMGDPRCLPYLRQVLHDGDSPYGLLTEHFPRGLSPIVRLPSINEVLAPLGRSAASLTPLLLQHLTPESGYHTQRAYAEVVAAWGPGAEDATGHLTLLLNTPSAGYAAQALAAIGPSAASSAESLVKIATTSPDAHIAIHAAAAHHGVTGDPGLALRVLTAALAEDDDAAAVARLLADLGPVARPTASALRQLAEHRDHWVRLEAQHALWCIDAQPMDQILHGLQPQPSGATLPALHRAVACLARHGAPEPARPSLHALLEHPLRLSTYGGWRSITADLQIRSDTRTALGTSRSAS